MTLQYAIDEAGGNDEMIGGYLPAGSLAETATLIGERGGFTVYALEAGGYWLAHESGSTHLVGGDCDAPEAYDAAARVVAAITQYDGTGVRPACDVYFDHGGGIIVQGRNFVHSYQDGEEAARDVAPMLLDGFTGLDYEGDEPAYCVVYGSDSQNYDRSYSAGELIEAMASKEPLPYISGCAEREFLAALTGREIEE